MPTVAYFRNVPYFDAFVPCPSQYCLGSIVQSRLTFFEPMNLELVASCTWLDKLPADGLDVSLSQFFEQTRSACMPCNLQLRRLSIRVIVFLKFRDVTYHKKSPCETGHVVLAACCAGVPGDVSRFDRCAHLRDRIGQDEQQNCFCFLLVPFCLCRRRRTPGFNSKGGHVTGSRSPKDPPHTAHFLQYSHS